MQTSSRLRPRANSWPRFTLLIGGVRSGKSRFAVDLAKRFKGRIVYLATCQPKDREMRQRIAHHQQERPTQWRTIEHPANLASTLVRLDGRADGAIVDCLTMYVSELLMGRKSDTAIQERVQQLCETIQTRPYPVIMVTNEVGSGVVPVHPLGRRFRDVAGLANQIAARCADQVYVLVAGIPMLIKKPAR